MSANDGLSVFVRAGEGETIFDRPERTIRILADHDELTLTFFRLEPGQDGPEPHVHRRHTDAFYVLEGELELGLGPSVQAFTAKPRTLAAAPPKVVHTFKNASDASVFFLNIHAPSMGFGDMLRAARDGEDLDDAQFDQFEPPADGGRPLGDASLRGPGDGVPVALGPSSALVKAGGSDTDGFFSLSETVLRGGVETLVQPRHRGVVDSFYVLEGTVTLQLEGEEVGAGPGDFALVPAGTVRVLTNRGAEDVRLLSLMAPARYQET